MITDKEHSKASAAGIAKLTFGRSRVFVDKKSYSRKKNKSIKIKERKEYEETP
jgi:hypothetical protein